MLERNKPKNYLKTSIYIVTTSVYNRFSELTSVRIPFATLATAKERYAQACAANPAALLQKLTVQGTPRGIGLAMYVLGNNKGIGTGEDVFGEYVEHVVFETITEQAGAL